VSWWYLFYLAEFAAITVTVICMWITHRGTRYSKQASREFAEYVRLNEQAFMTGDVFDRQLLYEQAERHYDRSRELHREALLEYSMSRRVQLPALVTTITLLAFIMLRAVVIAS